MAEEKLILRNIRSVSKSFRFLYLFLFHSNHNFQGNCTLRPYRDHVVAVVQNPDGQPWIVDDLKDQVTQNKLQQGKIELAFQGTVVSGRVEVVVRNRTQDDSSKKRMLDNSVNLTRDSPKKKSKGEAFDSVVSRGGSEQKVKDGSGTEE